MISQNYLKRHKESIIDFLVSSNIQSLINVSRKNKLLKMLKSKDYLNYIINEEL